VAQLTLPQLERHLFAAADVLSDKMGASESNCGVLFLKRCSDVFEERRETILAENLKRGRTNADAEKRADSPAYYADAFFVPKIVRWAHVTTCTPAVQFNWARESGHDTVIDGSVFTVFDGPTPTEPPSAAMMTSQAATPQ
jgi:hypothetical protein